MKITKTNAQTTLKEIQSVRDQIDDIKRRLQELAIMASKYGSTEKVDEELLYYREKIVEMDDRIAKLKIEIDVSNQINDNKRNEIRNRDEYIKRLRLMIEMRKNIPEPVVVQAPPPKVETEYVAVVGDDVDQIMAMKIIEHNCPVPCTRLGGGFYLFGTRKIYCKIMHGKLVVRVGGGYMSIDEFLITNSDHEMCRVQYMMEKEQVMDYEELTVYQTLVVKAGIKIVRVKSKVTSDMKMAGTFK